MRPRTSIGEFGRAAASNDVHFRQFDDEVVVLDLAGGQYFSLDAVGTRMWHALVAGKSPSEIAAELVAEYDVSRDRLLHDCVELADELIDRGLLRQVLP